MASRSDDPAHWVTGPDPLTRPCPAERRHVTTTQLNFERLELKFLIDEVTADRVRRAIASVCSPDRHGSTQRRTGSYGYVINSLYLDSHGLAFHEAKERGDPDRVKLLSLIHI